MKKIFKRTAIVIGIFGIIFLGVDLFVPKWNPDFCHCIESCEVIYPSDSEEKKTDCKRDDFGLHCREVSEKIPIAFRLGEFLQKMYRVDFLPKYLVLYLPQTVENFLEKLGSSSPSFILVSDDGNEFVCRCAK